VSALSLVDDSRPREWDGILADTRNLLAAARAGDWDRATRLERERRARIESFFATAPAPHEVAWVRSGIEEILASDARLLKLCQEGKEKVSAEIVELRQKAAANRAYAKTAGHRGNAVTPAYSQGT